MNVGAEFMFSWKREREEEEKAGHMREKRNRKHMKGGEGRGMMN